MSSGQRHTYLMHTAAVQQHVTVCSAAAGFCRAWMTAKGTMRSRTQLVGGTSAGGGGDCGDGGGGIGVHGFPLNCRGGRH